MVLVLITGSWKDAVFGFVILINTGIGIVTELKAKRTLDRLSILVTSDYAVRRDGEDIGGSFATTSCSATCCGYVPASRCRPTRRSCHHMGTGTRRIDADRRIAHRAQGGRRPGVLRVDGGVRRGARVRVNAVGEHSYAATLTAQAKVYKKTVSDLNKGINTILKFMTFLVVPLCVLLVWSQMRTRGRVERRDSFRGVAAGRGVRRSGRGRHDSRRPGIAHLAQLRGRGDAARPQEHAGAGARIGGDAGSRGLPEPRQDRHDHRWRHHVRSSASCWNAWTATIAWRAAATQALYDLSNEEQPNGTGSGRARRAGGTRLPCRPGASARAVLVGPQMERHRHPGRSRGNGIGRRPRAADRLVYGRAGSDALRAFRRARRCARSGQ